MIRLLKNLGELFLVIMCLAFVYGAAFVFFFLLYRSLDIDGWMTIALIPVCLIFFITINYVLFNASPYLKGLLVGSFKDAVLALQIYPRLTVHDIKFLQKECFYYSRLPQNLKSKFENRVARFMFHKNFIPKGQLVKIKRSQKLLISSCAVQIAFGFNKDLLLESFMNINLYDDQFINPRAKRYHLGEVNPRLGYISLSWKPFEETYKAHDSGTNLGLHEMAHALKFENFKKSPQEYLFIRYKEFKAFDVVAKKVFHEINNGNHTFIRAYAGTNSDEFFAVCLENFFERPKVFQKHEPELYESLVILLKQDPIQLLSL